MKWSLMTQKKLRQVTKMKSEGRTDKEVAQWLNIHKSTFYEWKKTKSEFSDALIIGEKEIVEKVKNRLIDMCLGFEYTETKISTKELRNENNERTGQTEITKQVTIKRVLPSVQAIMFYLTNKASDEYLDIKTLKAGDKDAEDNSSAGSLEDNINEYLQEMDRFVEEEIKG